MQLKPFRISVSLLAFTCASLACLPAAAQTNKPIEALLVIGGCCHDYEQQQKILTEGISARANVEWTIVHEGDGTTTHRMSVYNDPDWSKGYDVVVHDECSADVKDRDFVENILKPHREGLPAVNLHCAMHSYRVSFENFKDWFEFTGLETHAHGAQKPIALNFVDNHNPITEGMTNWTTVPEELYNNIHVYDTITPLIYGQQGADRDVVAWMNNYHGTRVFSTTLGHSDETVGDPRYLDLVTRGLLWSVNKLNADYLRPAKHVLSPSSHSEKKILVPINLALHKPATASGSQDGHDPAQAVDDDLTTRWCAPNNGDGYWWQVDLQKPEDLTGCRITWEQDDKPYQYVITGSANGVTWQTLVQETGTAGRPQVDEDKFVADGLRYIRITITKAPPDSWASFSEFEVLGKTFVQKTVSQMNHHLGEIKVPAGFDKTIFAAPPDISYPTCLAAAPTGEVFVGVDQNGSLDTSTNRGWVVRCLDTDGDGVADKFNVFAKMDSPRGLVFDHNVLYVMHPPVLEAFYDDHGTGTANRSEILVRGLGHDLGFRGADHTCNGVRMGIDGWLYIALGDYGALKAVGRDGTELQLHGGGILRVRPDGSELEIFARGTRNIFDVAIDPFMDVFTCDNTNDGDDWNVRLSHMIATAVYGYPTLFRHFSDEMIPTMADYGGGAPTGIIFLDEPGFPNGFGYGLYACQWGWDSVTRHPLQADGATFRTGRSPFVEIPRPTGIAEDGDGHLYVASWKGATFNYAGPNVGYVVQVTPTRNQPAPFPDLAKSTDEELLQYLASPSAVWRLTVQREILRRGKNPMFASGLEQLALNNESLAVRVAAIFTLNQLLGVEAQEALLRFAKIDSLRQYALKALADRKKDAANLPTSLFENALADANPAVRLEAVIALNRLDRHEAAAALLRETADSDSTVAQVAFRALVSLRAADVCFQALDQSKTALIPGAMRVLRNLHEAAVVDGLIARVGSSDTKPEVSRLIIGALCRLYNREADWDGSWWGTRPDTSGPYFKPVTWDQSEKIGQSLQRLLASGDEETLRVTLSEFQCNKVVLPGASSAFVNIAAQHPALLPVIVELLSKESPMSPDTVSFLRKIAADAQSESALRTPAFEALAHGNSPDALDAAVSVLTSGAAETDPAVTKLRDDFIHEERHSRSAGYFETLATNDIPARSELGFAVLIKIASSKSVPPQAKLRAEKAIDAAWSGAQTVNLLHAIAHARATIYTPQVSAHLHDSRAEVAAAASATFAQLSQDKSPLIAQRRNVIANLQYADVVKEASTDIGDPKVGAQLFEKLGCVKCHTTSKDQPLKGPFLGDITARYKKPEIIESILHPSAQIAQGFATVTLETKDGSDYDGFIVRESGDDIEIRNLGGATVVPKKDIVKRGTRKLSIMPEGLADQITPQELASLLAYLKSLQP
jgi:putative heme-binding domain-containing protein